MALEICVDSVESALNAIDGGADRLELCSSLALGGLTPTVGLYRVIRELRPQAQIFCMLRCRDGHFIYGQHELMLMKHDRIVMEGEGCSNFVFGALTKYGTVDIDACKFVIGDDTKNVNVTFHRAFDVCSNWKESLHELCKLKMYTRILTSGQADTVNNGRDTLIDIVHEANSIGNNCPVIMAGSGVTEHNLSDLKSIGITQFHSSASKTVTSETSIKMGGQSTNQLKIACRDKVAKMKSILNELF